MNKADIRAVAERAIVAAVTAAVVKTPEAREKAETLAVSANVLLDGNLERVALSLVRTGEIPILTTPRE